MKGFSNNLCQALNQQGHYITALDARTYFWEKKSPDQTTKDVAAILTGNELIRKAQQLVLIGYSFGADVMPFIVNKMPPNLKGKIKTVVLLSPSTSTDFEIHVSDLLGVGKKRGMDVVTEINRMANQKVVTLFGSEEKGFPLNDIHLRNHCNEVLPGGHHFDGNTHEVAKTISKYF
jgi:type IV secretory pathway VirJ component